MLDSEDSDGTEDEAKIKIIVAQILTQPLSASLALLLSWVGKKALYTPTSGSLSTHQLWHTGGVLMHSSLCLEGTSPFNRQQTGSRRTGDIASGENLSPAAGPEPRPQQVMTQELPCTNHGPQGEHMRPRLPSNCMCSFQHLPALVSCQPSSLPGVTSALWWPVFAPV
jgi:hypothetical protein